MKNSKPYIYISVVTLVLILIGSFIFISNNNFSGKQIFINNKKCVSTNSNFKIISFENNFFKTLISYECADGSSGTMIKDDSISIRKSIIQKGDSVIIPSVNSDKMCIIKSDIKNCGSDYSCYDFSCDNGSDGTITLNKIISLKESFI